MSNTLLTQSNLAALTPNLPGTLVEIVARLRWEDPSTFPLTRVCLPIQTISYFFDKFFLDPSSILEINSSLIWWY